jgi:ketosteroid isomerase-like protein
MKSWERRGLFWLILVASTVTAASATPQAEIRAVLDNQVAAWNRGDLEGFMQTYWKSPKTAYLGPNGIQRGWQSVLDRYRRAYPNPQAMGKTTFSDLEITMLAPDAAVVLGHWHLERASGNLGGVFSLVLRKFPQGWQIILDHTSLVKGPEKP